VHALLLQEASVRRAAVKQTLAARKAERKAERDALAQGIMVCGTGKCA
jgi:hypothetical protein